MTQLISRLGFDQGGVLILKKCDLTRVVKSHNRSRVGAWQSSRSFMATWETGHDLKIVGCGEFEWELQEL